MDKHTKEPWKVNDQRHSGWLNNAMLICGPEGHNIVRCYSDYHNEEANARRIVACVNAFRNAPIESIEKFADLDSNGPHMELTVYADDLRRQRDRLLDAAKDALSGWRYIRQMHGDLAGVGWDRVEEKLTSAIAEIEAA